MTMGLINELASLTHLRKNTIIAVVPFDASIQATGMPK
jgi:hypothetical protein